MKKIMFDNKFGLTDAVLKGSKTMTRRTCKEFSTGRIIYANEVESIGMYSDENIVEFVLKDGGVMVSAPPYKIGEVVAVAQSYKDLGYTKVWVEQHILPNPKANQNDPFEKKYPGWNNKMFVRADLMPHQIRITDVNVERLQDISDEDCMLEGIQEFDTPVGKCYVAGGVYVGQDGRLKIAKGMVNLAKPFKTPQEAFAALIDNISGKGTWERNPFVFAYTFELIR